MQCRKVERVMTNTNKAAVDPSSQRTCTHSFAIGTGYRWLIRGLCGLLVVMFATVIVSSGFREEWGVGLALMIVLSLFFIALLVHLVRLPRKTVMVNDEGLWLSEDADADAFVRWERVNGIREHYGFPGWRLVDSNGELLLRIHPEIDQYDQLYGLLRERTHIARRTPTVPTIVWMSPAYAWWCAGIVALGAFGGWVVWQEGLAGNWWFALAAIALPLYPLFAVVRMRVWPDTLELQHILWKRRIPLDNIASIGIVSGIAAPVVVIERASDGSVIQLEHLNAPAHELYEMLMQWRADGVEMAHADTASKAKG